MAIEISCPSCEQAHQLRNDYAGQTVRCRKCQGTFPVPGSATAAGGPLKRPAPLLAVAMAGGVFASILFCCIGVPVLALTGLGALSKTHTNAPPQKAEKTDQHAEKSGPKDKEKDKEDVESLIAALDSSDAAVRANALKALARLKDDRSIAPVAHRLNDAKDRKEAANTLIQCGRAAEEEVAKYLTDDDKAVRLEACRILKAIGTPKSKLALDQAAKDKEKEVAREAQNALKEIDKRGK